MRSSSSSASRPRDAHSTFHVSWRSRRCSAFRMFTSSSTKRTVCSARGPLAPRMSKPRAATDWNVCAQLDFVGGLTLPAMEAARRRRSTPLAARRACARAAAQARAARPARVSDLGDRGPRRGGNGRQRGLPLALAAEKPRGAIRRTRRIAPASRRQTSAMAATQSSTRRAQARRCARAAAARESARPSRRRPSAARTRAPARLSSRRRRAARAGSCRSARPRTSRDVEVPAHGRREPAREIVRGRQPSSRATCAAVDRVAAVVAGPIRDEALELRVAGDARRARARGSRRAGRTRSSSRAERVHDLEVRALARRRRGCTSRRAGRARAPRRMPAQWSST